MHEIDTRRPGGMRVYTREQIEALRPRRWHLAAAFFLGAAGSIWGGSPRLDAAGPPIRLTPVEPRAGCDPAQRFHLDCSIDPARLSR